MKSTHWDEKMVALEQRYGLKQSIRSRDRNFYTGAQPTGHSRNQDKSMRDYSSFTGSELRKMQKRIELELASREVKKKHAIRREESERKLQADLEAELSQIEGAQEGFSKK